MGLYRLVKTCYFEFFFVVLLHIFCYYFHSFAVIFTVFAMVTNNVNSYVQSNSMFSTRAAPSLKTNHYSPQPSASVNNVIYSTRFARGVNRVTLTQNVSTY